MLIVIAMMVKFLCSHLESVAPAVPMNIRDHALVVGRGKFLFQSFFQQLRGHGP